MRVVVLAGGTGSAKLLRGLKATGSEFSVVSNVGDNFWRHGLYIAPDVDIAVYTLAGIGDTARGWGIRDDTFHALGQLRAMGEETWFNLGDRDLATHVFRTEQMGRGKRLGDITMEICERLGVRDEVIPCTDDRLETYIETDLGPMHLQEFWVKNHGAPEVRGVEYRGEEGAKAAERAVESIEGADRIVFCPANPVTSLMPILAVDGVRRAIERSSARRVAVSPMVPGAPVNGPAGKLMAAIGAGVSSAGVSRLYRGLIDCLIIDPSDEGERAAISRDGIEAIPGRIIMRDPSEEEMVAREVLSA